MVGRLSPHVQTGYDKEIHASNAFQKWIRKAYKIRRHYLYVIN